MIWLNITKENLKDWFEDRARYEVVMWFCGIVGAQTIRGVSRGDS